MKTTILSICSTIFLLFVKGEVAPRECNFCDWNTCSPSLKGVANFNAQRDSDTIRNAIGFIILTNPEALIDVLVSRSEEQRLEIKKKYTIYKSHDEEALINNLYGVLLDPDIRTLINIWFNPLSTFFTEELHRVIQQAREKSFNIKNLVKIVEILTTLPDCAINEVNDKYKKLYPGQYLMEHIGSLRSFYGEPVTNTLQMLVTSGMRKTGNTAHQTPKQIEKDAKQLQKAIKDKNHKSVMEYLGKRMLPELRKIIKYYDDKLAPPLKLAIRDARLQNLGTIYVTIVSIAENPGMYYAEKLNTVLDYSFMFMVDRAELNLIILGRSGIDLEDIKKE